jgi:hypothetical protein
LGLANTGDHKLASLLQQKATLHDKRSVGVRREDTVMDEQYAYADPGSVGLIVGQDTAEDETARLETTLGGAPSQGAEIPLKEPNSFENEIATSKHDPHVCVLARICGPESECAPGESPEASSRVVKAFLSSLVAQVHHSWEVHVINGPGGGEVYQNVVSSFGDSRLINGPSSPSRFEQLSYGYEATNYALEKLLQDVGTLAPCKYFLFTNADNLYDRHFLQFGLQSMQADQDLIGFNFVTRYEQPDHNGLRIPHQPMTDAKFEYGHIDLGAVLVSAKAIRESGIRFRTAPVEDSKIADWTFFSAIMQRQDAKGSVMLKQLPFIHQLQLSP